jgi:hypothetical protein
MRGMLEVGGDPVKIALDLRSLLAVERDPDGVISERLSPGPKLGAIRVPGTVAGLCPEVTRKDPVTPRRNRREAAEQRAEIGGIGRGSRQVKGRLSHGCLLSRVWS